MCRQRWLAARPRTWLANGGVTKTTARSTSSSFNRSRAAALRSEDTVTTNGDEWRAEAARDALAISTSRPRPGPAGRLTPSATRPASWAIFGPKPPMMIGGVGSGRKNPPTPSIVPVQTDRIVATAASSAARLAVSPSTGRPKTCCSAAYGVRRPPPAPRPRSNLPPLTSWSVAAITPSVPGWRLATLRTIGPSAIRGTVAAMAVSVVQHSSTRCWPCTDPARWSYNHTPSNPSPSAAMAPSCISCHVAPNGSNNKSIFTVQMLPLLEELMQPPTLGSITCLSRNSSKPNRPDLKIVLVGSAKYEQANVHRSLRQDVVIRVRAKVLAFGASVSAGRLGPAPRDLAATSLIESTATAPRSSGRCGYLAGDDVL